MNRRALCILALAVAGCAPSKVAPPSTTAAQGIGGIEAQRRVMDGALESVEPRTDATGKAMVKVGRDAAKQQGAEVERVRKGLDELYVESNKWQARATRAESDLRAERDRFFSSKQRRLWWTFLIGWAVFGVAGTVLSLTGFVGAGRFILNLLPFANPFRGFVASRQQQPTVNVVVEK